jgi:hypothetical protein
MTSTAVRCSGVFESGIGRVQVAVLHTGARTDITRQQAGQATLNTSPPNVSSTLTAAATLTGVQHNTNNSAGATSLNWPTINMNCKGTQSAHNNKSHQVFKGV